MRQDSRRVKIEILNHLGRDLVTAPRPSLAGERRAEITGRVRAGGLLRGQEAVCLQVVAGTRNPWMPSTFGAVIQRPAFLVMTWSRLGAAYLPLVLGRPR
jgi:hypothetical protein